MRSPQPIASTCRGCYGPVMPGESRCPRCGLATSGESQRGVLHMRSADFDGRPNGAFATAPFDGVDGPRPASKARNTAAQKPTSGATIGDRLAARKR